MLRRRSTLLYIGAMQQTSYEEMHSNAKQAVHKKSLETKVISCSLEFAIDDAQEHACMRASLFLLTALEFCLYTELIMYDIVGQDPCMLATSPIYAISFHPMFHLFRSLKRDI